MEREVTEPMDSSLRQQFQTLQEQQKKKLLKRKQKQEEGKVKAGEKEFQDVNMNSLGVTDDMELQLSEPVSQDTIFNEELNTQLQEQLRELKDETGRLYKLLSERDHEVRKLKKKREEDRLALSGMGEGMAGDAAATKIVELSKKNRELTAELESEKTRLKQLLLKLREAEKMNKSDGPSRSPPRSLNGEEAGKVAAELKSTQEKLSQATSKLGEFRTQVATLKQDLKLAHKALSNEVGDGVSIQAILAGNSNWRGRAQQILILQNKISDLKSQLEEATRPITELSLEDQFMNMDVSTGEDGGSTVRTIRTFKSSGSTSRGSRIEDVNRNRLKQMEKERREAKEKAHSDLQALEEDHKKLKEKFEAAKARNRVLANEVKSCKQQIMVLLDKGKHDNELIEALMNQQGHLKTMLEEKTAGYEDSQKKQEQASLELKLRGQQEANVVEQLKRIIEEKESKVKRLEEDIVQMQRSGSLSLERGIRRQQGAIIVKKKSTMKRLREDIVQMQRSKSQSGSDFHLSSHHQLLDGANSAISVPSPPSRHSIHGGSRQSNRPPSRPSREDSTISSGVVPGSRNGYRPSSTGSLGKPSSPVGSSEVQRQFQEYKSLLQVAEVERDRVMELVKVLQERCDESTVRGRDLQLQVTEVKQRNAQLEKQLDRLKVENSRGSSKKSGRRPVSTLTSTQDLLRGDVPVSQEATDELQARLAIQIDENNALKTALQSTLHAKEEDLRLYQQMMEQTKQVFLTGLRQYRQMNT